MKKTQKETPINSLNRIADDLNVPEPTPNGIRKMIAIIRRRIRSQGWIITSRWLYVILLSNLFGYVPIGYSQITPQIFVGSQHRFLGKLRLRSFGVTASVNLREEFDDSDRNLLFEEYLYLPVPDETPVSIKQLQQGIEFMQSIIENGGKVYVHCASGVGRSVMLATAYFIQQGMTVDEAFAKIKQIRPFIYLFPSQLERLNEFASTLQVHDE